MPCQYGTRTAPTFRVVPVDESLCKLEGVQSELEAMRSGIRQALYNAGEQHLLISIPLQVQQLIMTCKHATCDDGKHMKNEKQQSGAHAITFSMCSSLGSCD